MTFKINVMTSPSKVDTERLLDAAFTDTVGMVVIAVHPNDKVQCIALDMDSATAAEVLRECALMFKLASKSS